MSIKTKILSACLTAFLASPCAMSQAASLQVAPVSVEVAAPGAAATLTVRNEGERPLDAQIRVFKWTQVNGEDKLEPTDDVAASPPLVSLKPGSNYVVRVVRTNKTPVAAEEAYRLLIDELPSPNQKRAGTVNIVLRYSIPVFFNSPTGGAPKLTWALQRRANKPVVVATNDGDRRVRLAKLKVTDSKGATADFGEGLAGYVLSHSTKVWTVPARVKGFGTGSVAAVSAESDTGPVSGIR
jgi:fimbrial chaperone protein